MKWLIVFMLFVFSLVAVAQEKTYSVPESQLTQEQKQQLQKKSVIETVESISYFKGVGKEVGEAVSTGLSALNKEVNSFSESSAGKFTMFIITYKVLGKDIIRVAIGFPIWFIGTIFFVIVFYRNCVSRNVLATKEGPFWNRKKTYNYKDLNDGDYQWGHFGGYVIFTLAMALVTLVGSCN